MNYSRKELKAKAKQVLRKSYFMALIVSVILGVITTGGFSALFISNPFSQSAATDGSDASYESGDSIWSQITSFDRSELEAAVAEAEGEFQEGEWQGDIDELLVKILFEIIKIALIAVLVVWLIGILFRVFVLNHLEVGARGYFTDTAQGLPSGLGRLKHGFQKGAYLNITAVMLLREIFISLWTLLFIIPGIIKGLSYAMVPYLLAEDPSMGYKDALKTSAKMMRGYKWRYVVLTLSFLGWILLGTMIFGIGQILVWPYINATLAQFYHHVKENAEQQP